MLLNAVHRIWGRQRFVQTTDAEIQELFAATMPLGAPIESSEVERLAPAVRRWLERSGVVGRPRPTSVRLLQDGQLRTSRNGPAMSARADQYVRIPDPAFIWRVDTRLFRLLSFTGRDRYSSGHGNMRIQLASLMDVVNADDEKIASGALLRFLAEMVWYPSAALEPYVDWQAVGETHATARLRHAGLEVEASFEVDADGRVVGVSAERFLGGGEGAKLEPWSVRCTAWGRFAGVEVPTEGTVAWDLEAGSFVYYRWRVTDVEYDRPCVYQQKSVWE
ncbi:MAG: hypothetical protein KC766_03230 [Myxococcales bacterium]|nr:hypothetical protein [Myxococcales bacterium]